MYYFKSFANKLKKTILLNKTFFTLTYDTKTFCLISKLYNEKLINNYKIKKIINNNKEKTIIIIFLNIINNKIKNVFCFNRIKGDNYYTIKKIKHRLNQNHVLILSTTFGILTDKDTIRYNKGGKCLFALELI